VVLTAARILPGSLRERTGLRRPRKPLRGRLLRRRHAVASLLIVTIARRRAIDRLRSTHAARERDHIFAARDYQPDWDHAADRGEIRVAFAPVANAIRALPQIHREVLVLAYLHGYSHSEIALALGLPLGTVKSRLRDTVLRLRLQLVPTTA
jgi:RNA polymerase sigma-70 factor, ECF subfamily